METIGGPYGTFEQGLSVAHTQFTAAVWMGCDPIVLIGHDFAYSPDRRTTHAEGTALNRNVETILEGASSVVIAPRPETPEPIQQEIVWVKGVEGGMVPTSKTMAVFLNKFSNDIRKCKAQIYDATEGGAWIKGTQHKRLEEILPTFTYVEEMLDNVEIFKSRKSSKMDRIFPALETLLSALKQCAVDADNGLRIINLLEERNEISLRECPEWKDMDTLFWNIHRNESLQIALEQALFPSLYQFIQQEKNEPDVNRMGKYKRYFQSVITLVDEFGSLIQSLRTNIRTL